MCDQPLTQGCPEPGDKDCLAAKRANHFYTAQHLLEVSILQTDSLAAGPFGMANMHLEISGYPYRRHHRQCRDQRQQRAEGKHGHSDGAEPKDPHQDRGPTRPALSPSR
jgi:hypothetical protein